MQLTGEKLINRNDIIISKNNYLKDYIIEVKKYVKKI